MRSVSLTLIGHIIKHGRPAGVPFDELLGMQVRLSTKNIVF